MSSQLLDIFLLALLAMFNPSLLAAVTVMLLLPNPKRLMVGYLLGAYVTSITLGLVIVFSLSGSSTESTSKHTVSPVEDIVVGLLAVTIAFVLRTGRDQPFQQRRREKKDAKLKAKVEAGKPTESLPLRMLGKGDPKVTSGRHDRRRRDRRDPGRQGHRDVALIAVNGPHNDWKLPLDSRDPVVYRDTPSPRRTTAMPCDRVALSTRGRAASPALSRAQ